MIYKWVKMLESRTRISEREKGSDDVILFNIHVMYKDFFFNEKKICKFLYTQLSIGIYLS